ncbi:MAG: CDP-diacylglycerol--glycerol-3-phosphate 3-phosphatidyltransferase [Lachnospiraceae bacterium]|nr:CDP-diacylglycerol--glycerol-3-phosphate 3-phosphatidyltransferase [Lachnospiraceae bacterium]
MIDKNLPNKLTMCRVIAIPIFIVLFMLGFRIGSAVVFVLASITDYFDGVIARKYNLISNFGKLMDPLADKMLVITALFLLTETREVHFLCTLIVILRELTISSIRLIALEQNKVIAASMWGKFKTATQMVAIILLLFKFYNINVVCYYITYGLFYISTALVIISLIDYVIKSKEVFTSKL